MSNPPEEFEKLQKLLKLKRHEQPPPGYFNNFSDRVINRIEAMDSRKDRWEAAPWVGKLYRLLETNPIAAGLFGISVCGLLISGITYSQSKSATDFSAYNPTPLDVADASKTASEWSKTVRADSTAPSVNPMFNTNVPGTLFGGLDKLSVQQVNFSPGN
jgi:hypothetical protein